MMSVISSKINPSRINQARLAGIDTSMPVAPEVGGWPTEVLLFTQMPVAEAEGWQAEAAAAMREGTAPGHRLVVTEHPPTAGEATFLPGVLHGWLTVGLGHGLEDIEALRQGCLDLIVRVAAEFEIDGAREGDAVKVGGRTIGALRITAGGGVALARVSININADPALLHGDEYVSMTALGLAVERQADVRGALLTRYEEFLGSKPVIPQRTGVKGAKPPWLRVKLPVSAYTRPVHDVIKERGLHTVCESARCPNQGECWGHGTATFMINGDVCTRSCSFCAIHTGRPKPLDADEPRRVGEAARIMNLNYSVVTAVNRDELPDGGAGQFVKTIEALRESVPGIRVEVLIPDFRGVAEALDAVFAARPEVLNHNVETVPRLYPRVRPQAVYERSLAVIRRAKAAGLVTKSGLMVGLGEESDEVEALLRDLREAGCDIVTIGQYLRPSEWHHPVVRYVTPAEFAQLRNFGMELGFQTVQSGPLVRSSYHAHDSFAAASF